jgi:predicted dehydrogenase
VVSVRSHGVGLVGVGNISGAHLEAFKDVPGWDVVAVCDIIPERARAAAERYGIPHVFPDVESLVASDDVEIVDVATQPEPRVAIAKAAIDAGKHMLCEKPLCTDASDAESLATAATAAGIVHAVCHEYRYHPQLRTMRALVEDGFVGDPRMVALERSQDTRLKGAGPVWMRDCSVGGGFVLQALVHTLDLVRYVCGDYALDAFESFGDATDAPPGAQIEDGVAMTGRMASGAVFSAWGGWTVPQPQGVRWAVHGSAGSLRFESDSHRTADPGARLLGGAAGEELYPLAVAEGAELPEAGAGRPFVHQLFAAMAVEVLAAIDGTIEAPLFSTFDDAARLMRGLEVS